MSSNEPPLVYLQRDFGGLVDLTYKSISTRGTTKSTCRYIPPHRQQSTDAKVKALAGNEKHETTVLFKLPEHSHAATANTTSTKPNFIDSATISQPSDIHVFQDMHHIVIYCHDLLEFQPNSAGFASIIVRAGLETCLIRHPRDLSTFLITKRDAFTTPQGEFGAFAVRLLALTNQTNYRNPGRWNLLDLCKQWCGMGIHWQANAERNSFGYFRYIFEEIEWQSVLDSDDTLISTNFKRLWRCYASSVLLEARV